MQLDTLSLNNLLSPIPSAPNVMNKRNVALVLSSGGARGYAHIGAIQALEEHQFQITSVAGTSMGALVGGMYCAGRLDAVKERMCSLTRR